MDIATLNKTYQRSKQIMNQLKESYPQLKGWLVYSNPLGQVELTLDVAKILQEFPGMVAPSPKKEMAFAHMKKKALLEENLKKRALVRTDKKKPSEQRDPGSQNLITEIQKINVLLEELLPTLEFTDDIQVELRFDKLDYALISLLQRDERIDPLLTPQTPASIRIALGTAVNLGIFD